MRRRVVWAIAASLALGATGCRESQPPSRPKVDDPVVVSWDGGSIRLSQLERRYRIERMRDADERMNGAEPQNREEKLASLLRDWVLGEILEKEARRLGIEIDPQRVSEYLENRIGGRPQQDAAFIDADTYREDYRREVWRRLALGELGKKLIGETPLEEEEFARWLERNDEEAAEGKQERRRCVSQLVVRDEKSAKRLLEKLKEKTPIEVLAREKSVTPEAERGGFMGCFKEGELPEYLEEVVFRLKAGKPSKIIQSSYGYHILMVKKEAESDSAEEERLRVLRKRWIVEETDRRIQAWFEEALDKNGVRFNKSWDIAGDHST